MEEIRDIGQVVGDDVSDWLVQHVPTCRSVEQFARYAPPVSALAKALEEKASSLLGYVDWNAMAAAWLESVAMDG